MVPQVRPTQASLAAALGVSRQTVSNVINSPGLVRPATRKRVEDAIKASGYRPQIAGRALRTHRSGAIGMRLHPVVDGVNGEVLDRFFHAVTETAQARGYRINLFTAGDAETEVAQLTDMFHQGVIDGALLIDSRLRDPRPAGLAACGLPFVVFGRPWGDPGAAHSWVDVDGRAGVYRATQHLVAAGHRVGFIGWPSASAVGEDRRAGWLAAGGDEADQYLTEDTTRDGLGGAQVLRARGVTAVVCVSDGLALGAVQAFAGRAQGGELPVIGFDNTPVARALGLSSVSQPVEAAAALILRSLLDAVEQREAPPPSGVLLVPTLELRQWEPIAAYPNGEEQ
ncbi:MAG: LacI family transcriptional regulator [Propionibacteriaceae bacterium]|jgi:DNA-binding LacI/PurR family transcriptional regulator|nr:LacI family transcriptional regulator [Propionibacteriaceae bacterium]